METTHCRPITLAYCGPAKNTFHGVSCNTRLNALKDAVNDGNRTAITALLQQLVPGYHPEPHAPT